MITVGRFKSPVSSQTEKLMAAIKFSDYSGLKHYKKERKGFEADKPKLNE